MPLSVALNHQLSVGLGSDVGAGRSFSLRKACARAYDASRISQSEVRPSELLWLATRGGALATGRDAQVGCIEEGFEADLTCVALPPGFELSQGLSEAEQIEALAAQLIFCEDWQGTERVVVRGREVWRA
jgi:guanine deaminase